MIKIAIFDMDGTLTTQSNCWSTLYKHYKYDPKVHYAEFDAKVITDYELGVKCLTDLYNDSHPVYDDIRKTLIGIKTIKGIEDTLVELKKRGISSIILTSGIDILSNYLMTHFGFDAEYSNGLVFDASGNMLPKYIDNVEYYGKGKVFDNIVKQYGVSKDEVMSIGDTEFDIPFLEKSEFSIAINPKDNKCADCVSKVIETDDIYDITFALDKYNKSKNITDKKSIFPDYFGRLVPNPYV